jgi:class 3 adenylate cyclase/tetratricopeptide (TPR) repeat protein
MSPTIEEQIERLNASIAGMEAQRDSLGDAVVEQAVAPLHEKLAELNRLLEASKSPPPEKPLQQRKLLTILFMDIVGSTSIIQHMDPEDVSEIFDLNLKRLAQPIEDHGGHVTSFTGDGFLAIFGTPTAREDDPERAVRAGLAVIQRAEEIAKELEKDWNIHDFKVRVGVNTGLVILGGETEGEDTTKGPAVHMAARLQSAAPPGELLISHDTYQHIRGVFNVEAWEPLMVKGFDEPVQVYHVLNAKPRTFRSYTRGVEGVETRMVGRHDELKYLQDALLSIIEESEGQLVTIMGEAGVGKSRLLYEFQNWIDLQPTRVRFYEGRAHQEAQGMPLALLRDLFEFRFQLQENDSKEAVREKVAAGFEEAFGLGEDRQMRTHILGQWLGFDFSPSPQLQGVLNDPEQLRNRGLMYLGEYFKGLCAQAPVVVFLEDIHWADDSSLDALNWLGERFTQQPLLFICAARHTLLERRPYWGEGLVYHHRIELEPLSKRESHQLVDEILKLAEHVPAELVELLVEGAEGNPFYVEELVKMLVEDGVIVNGDQAWQVLPERLSDIKVPPTLAGVLQARLESLPQNEQKVLQQASVVGRLFWDQVVEHIQAAEGGKPQAVPEALASLRSREMVYRREASAFADAREYLFKHDILREVTYESVLKKLRRRYHGLVADWLISQVGGRAGEYSGLIAGHLLQAGRQEQAGTFFLQAGQAALASFANAEAEKYFRQALEQSLAEVQKAACLAGLGEAIARQGFKQEVIEIFRQGIDLNNKLGDSNRTADLYERLAHFLWWIDYQEAWEICQEGLKQLEGTPESPGMARLLAQAGRAAHFISRPAEEVSSLCQRAIEMAERQGEQAANAEARITIALYESDTKHESDTNRSIQLLQETAAFSEANQLWNAAARAYNNLGVELMKNLQNLETVNQQNLRAVHIYMHIGNLEGLFFELDNLAECSVEQGNLNTVKDELIEILRNSTAAQSRIDAYLNKIHSESLYYRGEWSLALEYNRHCLEEEREKSQYQFISERNIQLAYICLELNRFMGMSDLSMVEAGLRENIDKDWEVPESRSLLVVTYANQRRFIEAHEQLTEIGKDIIPPLPKIIEELRLIADVDLARSEGYWVKAVSKCQTLIDMYLASGYRWRRARALIDLGDMLIGRDFPGDREQARQVYQQSLEMFTEMGAPGYIQVLEERLGINKAWQ